MHGGAYPQSGVDSGLCDRFRGINGASRGHVRMVVGTSNPSGIKQKFGLQAYIRTLCGIFFMNKMKLIVKTGSANLWWGIYGFCEKTGWEDLDIFNDKEEKIGAFCLNTKRYLRSGVEDLRTDPGELEFVQAIDKYLEDNRIHYWYYYNDSSCENFYEVLYSAPLNEKGENPDIWIFGIQMSVLIFLPFSLL